MITREQAEKLVYAHINRPDAGWPGKPEMILTRTDERELGWLVYWTSRLYHETRDFRHAIVGTGPYLVSREDGSLYGPGSAPPLEERIREAERALIKAKQEPR